MAETGSRYRSGGHRLPQLAVRAASPDRGDAGTGCRGRPAVADRDLLAAALLERIAVERKAELERGVTLVGPHRDDLVLKLGPLPAKGYASHGESWSFALALRLAAYELLAVGDRRGGEPVLILDDVFAELDGHRRERLAAWSPAPSRCW